MGVDTKQRTTKHRTYKTAKSQRSDKQNGEQQITANNKTATITKQRTLKNSEHNKTAIISKWQQSLFSSVRIYFSLLGQFTVLYDVNIEIRCFVVLI